jgi:hypothetical protein
VEIIMVADKIRFGKPQGDASSSCSREWINENPFTSVTVLFGLGVGVGVLLGHVIAESAGRTLFHEDTLAEKLAGEIRKVLKSTLPKGISRHVS